MTRRILLASSALLLTATVSHAQAQTLSFEQAAYVSCREAQAMQPEARKQLAVFLAEHSARHRGVILPDDNRGGQLAMLVRGGCTLSPDAYLFTVIDRAIQAETNKLAKR
ncbi:MAG: hypothetical protein JSR90_18345 [Proteobacteria bacterium]|nr:hypothetical protein [Pseudomonadota bacterium]